MIRTAPTSKRVRAFGFVSAAVQAKKLRASWAPKSTRNRVNTHFFVRRGDYGATALLTRSLFFRYLRKA